MQKLFFSLTFLQLFSLSANSPFENNEKLVENSYFKQAIPMPVIHTVYNSQNTCPRCTTQVDGTGKIQFVCPSNLTSEELEVFLQAYYKTVLTKSSSNDNQEDTKTSSSEENNQNETGIEAINSKTELLTQNQE